MTSPTNGQPTGPADLREARHQARLAAQAAEPKPIKVRTGRAGLGKIATAKPPKIEAKVPKRGPVVLPPKPSTGPTCSQCGAGPFKNLRALSAHGQTHRKPVPVETPMGHAFTITVPKASAEVHPTREAWMQAAVEAMRPDFEEVGSKVGPVSISIGWAGGRGSKKNIRGQCWASHTTRDRLPAIFVMPDQDDALTILGIIRHEMNHAADDGISGHKGAFAKNAKALGFLKPWTSSDGKTPELIERLTALLAELGPFPHAAITDRAHGLTGLSPLAPPVQTTRMLKVQCPTCGCILRMTNKWIAEAGLPTCGCGEAMKQAEAGQLALLGL